jgi:hypothetical protein
MNPVLSLRNIYLYSSSFSSVPSCIHQNHKSELIPSGFWAEVLLYCGVLPVNTSNNLVGCGFCVSIYWILHQAEFTITYITSNYITWTSKFFWYELLLRNCCDEHLFQTAIADCSWWTPNPDVFWWTAITTCSSRLPWPDCFDNQSLAPYIVSVIHCCLFVAMIHACLQTVSKLQQFPHCSGCQATLPTELLEAI